MSRYCSVGVALLDKLRGDLCCKLQVRIELSNNLIKAMVICYGDEDFVVECYMNLFIPSPPMNAMEGGKACACISAFQCKKHVKTKDAQCRIIMGTNGRLLPF